MGSGCGMDGEGGMGNGVGIGDGVGMGDSDDMGGEVGMSRRVDMSRVDMMATSACTGTGDEKCGVALRGLSR